MSAFILIFLIILALVIAWLWPVPQMWAWPPEWTSPKRELIRIGLPALWVVVLVLGLTAFNGDDPTKAQDAPQPVGTVTTTRSETVPTHTVAPRRVAQSRAVQAQQATVEAKAAGAMAREQAANAKAA